MIRWQDLCGYLDRHSSHWVSIDFHRSRSYSNAPLEILISRCKVLVLLLLVILFSLVLRAEQTNSRVESAKQISSQMGWAATSNHLYWTNDGGAHWSDISPPSQGLTDVFFADQSNGWVLFSEANEESNLITFRLARTSDSGNTWSISPLRVPSQRPDELDGRAWLNFADPMHGWVAMQARSSSAFSWGLLLATKDGGNSWQELGEMPIAGRPVFINSEDGWVAGNAGGGGIFRTQDGGKSWQADGPSFEDLPESFPTRISYGQIKFDDLKHGSIPLWFSPTNDSENGRGTSVALYVTDDGGRTWKRESTLTDHSHAKSGAPLWRFGAIAATRDKTGQDVLIAAISADTAHPNRLGLSMVGHTVSGGVRNSENALKPNDSAAELSFINDTQGWARTASGDLLSTNDGGATWVDITPAGRASLSPSIVAPMKKQYVPQSSNMSAEPINAQFSASTLTVAQGMAFDQHNVHPLPT